MKAYGFETPTATTSTSKYTKSLSEGNASLDRITCIREPRKNHQLESVVVLVVVGNCSSSGKGNNPSAYNRQNSTLSNAKKK